MRSSQIAIGQKGSTPQHRMADVHACMPTERKAAAITVMQNKQSHVLTFSAAACCTSEVRCNHFTESLFTAHLLLKHAV